LTYTINGIFGAGVIAGGTGFLLNDGMDDFTAKSPDRNGLRVRGWRDSERVSKPDWKRDVDPSHSAAA
jgi:gamma-glutamyltranspeptidase/glutathione hydrolase